MRSPRFLHLPSTFRAPSPLSPVCAPPIATVFCDSRLQAVRTSHLISSHCCNPSSSPHCRTQLKTC